MGLFYQRKNNDADDKGKTAQFTDFLHLLSNNKGDTNGEPGETDNKENNDNKDEK